jgi:excisionase family DNA binding protein
LPQVDPTSTLISKERNNGGGGDNPPVDQRQAVADATGLKLYRVYELAREGRLPHRRFGRSVRFTAEAVAAYLSGTEMGTPTGK